MKIYSTALVVIVVVMLMLLQGCASKEPEIVTVVKTKVVKVVVPCKNPEVTCKFDGEEYGSVQLLKCVIAQKRALEACDGK